MIECSPSSTCNKYCWWEDIENDTEHDAEASEVDYAADVL